MLSNYCRVLCHAERFKNVHPSLSCAWLCLHQKLLSTCSKYKLLSSWYLRLPTLSFSWISSGLKLHQNCSPVNELLVVRRHISTAYVARVFHCANILTRELSDAPQPKLTFEHDSLLTKYLDSLVEKYNQGQHQVAELLESISSTDVDAKSREEMQLKVDQLNHEVLHIEPAVILISRHRQISDEIQQLHDIIKGLISVFWCIYYHIAISIIKAVTESLM